MATETDLTHLTGLLELELPPPGKWVLLFAKPGDTEWRILGSPGLKAEECASTLNGALELIKMKAEPDKLI